MITFGRRSQAAIEKHVDAVLGARTPPTVAVERRDPRGATQHLGWTSPGQGMVAEWDAETAIRMAFYANVIVYRCTQILANTVASLPFRAGRAIPAKPGMAGDHDPNARLAQLLGPPPGGPAPKLSARRLWAWTVAQRIVTGRHGWEIEETAGGDITALWPLTSSRLEAVASTGGSEWFSSFKYGRYDNPARLRPDQIVYGWDPALHDFRQPESALQAARLDISVAVMMDRYNVAFLRNDARPAALVVTEAFASDDDFRAFKGQWRGEYAGPENAGKTAFVEANGDTDKGVAGMVDVKVLGLSAKDAMFVEQHKAALERVAIAIGVPWSKLDASGRTFDNAGEEDHAWWESTLLPRLADFADEVNMQLAPRVGREVGWFDTSGVRALQPERKFLPVGPDVLVDAGLASRNEARQLVGLDPVDDAAFDEYEIAQPAAPLAVLPAPEEPVVEEPANTEELPASAAAPEPERREPVDHEARRTKIWKTTDMVVRSLERRWERRFRTLFARQEAATITRLEGKRGRQALRDQRGPADEVFDHQHWLAESQREAADLYDAVLSAGAARISDLYGIDFDLEAEWAQAFVQARANQLAGQVTTTTYEAIQATLAEGVAAGEPIDLLAGRIRHVFDVASKSRATTIARTEVISAYNGAATLTGSQLPADVVAGREWIATRDGRTRSDHAEADGQVVAMDAPFDVGGDALEYPGDPAGSGGNTVNCRCTIGFLTPDEMGERARQGEMRVAVASAAAVLAMVGDRFDEHGFRRALAEVAA